MARTRLSDTLPDPSGTPPVPADEVFSGDYLPSDYLEAIRDRLIRTKAGFGFLTDYRIAMVWKRKAGTKAGKVVMGTCQKATGLVKHFGEVDYVVAIAADSARLLTNLQLDALVFHELCHISEEEDDEGNVKPGIIGHDLEMFLSELEEYGTWRAELRAGHRAFNQLELNLVTGEITAA